MVTTEKLNTNRLNALLSTGPRTPAGLTRSAQNAVKCGLFSKALVLPALNESADELDRFRTAVAIDLGAVGLVERELADRAAGILWRLRRVAGAEAAALAVPGAQLPPHPDDVEYLTGDASLYPVPPGATAVYRLGHVRALLRCSAQDLPERRAAVAALGADIGPKEPVGAGAACRVLCAAASEREWNWYPCPWGPALAAAGCRRKTARGVRWTTGKLRRVLRCAAEGANLAAGPFFEAVRKRLAAELGELEQRFEVQRRLEAELVGVVLGERAAAAAARVVSDDGLIQRIARAEGHLSRELDRALSQLSRLQSARRAGDVAEPDDFGFVLRNDVVRPPLVASPEQVRAEG